MPKQLLFYELATPVSLQRHADWSVKTDENYSFAAGVNSVPLTTAEFAAAAAHCPIVFSIDGDVVLPVAVVGLENDKSLFVDKEGRWTSSFIPAFVRRYPFVFSMSPDQKSMTLCIDESCSAIDRSGQTGERLFTSDGGRSPYLERMLQFATAYQQEHQRTVAFASRVQALGLLEPAEATLTVSSAETRRLTGFQRVSRERLAAIDGAVLRELFDSGGLECIYLHLFSLGAFGELARRRREAA